MKDKAMNNSVYTRISKVACGIAKKAHKMDKYVLGQYGLSYGSIAEGSIAILAISAARNGLDLNTILYLPDSHWEALDSNIGLKAIGRAVWRYIWQEKSIGKPIVKEHLDSLTCRYSNRVLHGLGYNLSKLANEIVALVKEGHKIREVASLLGLPKNWKAGLKWELSKLNPELAKILASKPKKISNRAAANRRAYLKRKADKEVVSVVVLPQWV
jgi:hypothetical protein